MIRFDIWATERAAAQEMPNGLRIQRVDQPKPVARIWHPKATKPAVHFSFGSIEKREQYIGRYVTSYEAIQREKADRRAAQSVGDASLADPGNVYRYSWGYEQTNIDYFQVVKRSGTRVTFAPIAQELVEQTGFMSETVRPAVDRFLTICAQCGGGEHWACHHENLASFTHTYQPKIEHMVKRLTFYDGRPYFSMEFGGLSHVEVHRFANGDPLVVGSDYQSHYA